ncbi:right-handed parallel beta-helix repeat-containing protein [Actinoallomurus spadix]|uniref:Pectate lyase superfamily protein domain-containing protein n=1 Tax=Actinoallomurus spadix TaxID=79912 RepID=A0ABN0WWM4_9ACTN|nr:glycosyl hydrolase family 28-related protein [Actinoallomurus spadix]MCO5986581.1 right-handed parallel beta-helix repeat-containing protein [Actinoallomurus spadix]
MRIYNRGFRAENTAGGPIPAAHVTLWDAQTGGTQITSGIETLDGAPIPGAVLICDAWGYAPSFRDTEDRPDIWAIGSDTGVIPGVERVHLEPDDTDQRVSALESTVNGPSGIDSRLSAIEASRGQPSGIATLDDTGKVDPAQLPLAAATSAQVNVADYGAAGNGTTDDAPAIQAALDAIAVNTPGARLVFPPGTYLVNSELEIKSSIHLDLSKGATIKRGSSSMQYILKNFNASYSPTLYGGRGGIRITGGVVDAAGDVLTGSVTAIIVAHAKDVRIEGVTVRNVRDWHGVELNSSRDGTVRDCIFEGFNPVASGRTISEAVQLDLAIDSSALPGIGAGAYDKTPCDNILVTGCTARSYGSLGSFGRLTGSHSYSDNVFHTRIRVVDNYAIGCNDYAVRAYNWWDAIVAENEFVNCNGAFMADVPTTPVAATVGHEGFVFSKNICRGLGVQNAGAAVLDYAVRFEGTDTASPVPVREVTVKGNILKTVANPQGAIRFTNVGDVVCSDNTVKDGTGTATRGIHVVGSSQGTYTGNKISSVTGMGIQVYDGANTNSGFCTFTGNTIQASGDAGLHINSTAPTVTGNNINGVTGGACGMGIWNNASNASVIGNKVVKGTGTTTSGIEIRNSTTLMANTVLGGWTATSTDIGASGQNLYVNGGSVFPTTPRTYNKC